MRSTEPHPIRTGGDPRSFPDFSALRDEMSKQTHPARPDIHWSEVEKLALSLFEKNGIELQTGAWYTLARSHLAKCAGMNEGLSILGAILGHQWAQFWPQSPHARVEILAGMFQRLQKVFRTFSLGSADRSSLLNLENTLGAFNDSLVRQELQSVSQITPLLQQVRSAIMRLENASSPELASAGIALSVPVESGSESAEQHVGERSPQLVYVIRQEPAVQVEVQQDASPPPKWGRAFASGMAAAFVVSAVAFTGWHYFTHPSAEALTINTALQPLPHPLTSTEIASLNVNTKNDKLAARWISQTSARLNTLAALPPDWRIQYGQGLVSQANALWPERPDAKQLETQWQQQLALNGISADSLNGWHEGMSKLQELTTQLNALDGQRGKYITVSELKSQVFGMLTSFRQTVPVEEQFRQLKLLPEDSLQRQQQIQQAEQHLRAQISTLAQEKQRD
ncbi:VasL domain-containing protein [Gibbsiella dentisursi]|uniref:VasL domain-containing protein n=1 Tax=Gibbsiella dentisursi TaxID=796890 RepID=A0ABP7LCG2_9GAMM